MGELQAAQVQAFLVAHDVLCHAPSLGLGPRDGSDGLICFCPIGGENASVSRHGAGVGGGGNESGHDDCDDGDGPSLVRRERVICVRIDLGRALSLGLNCGP